MDYDQCRKRHSTIVQITTPYTIGTGFCISDPPLVATNEHIVRDNRNAIVDHPVSGRQVAQVVYLDPKRDLALLRLPIPIPMLEFHRAGEALPKEGQQVWALGGKPEQTVRSGVITESGHLINGVRYLQHNAGLEVSDSGGPLFDSYGQLVGMNSFLAAGSGIMGLCLPSVHLQEAVAYMRKATGKTASRCIQCDQIVSDHNLVDNNNCPQCRVPIQLPSQIADYQPIGIAATIEQLLTNTGHQPTLSRRGPNSWQVQHGSADIHISYYEKNGLIVGDAYLCVLPSDDNEALYAFLLKQNFDIENLSFSIKDDEIVLSLMIYDRYLNEETGLTLFKYLFERADHYDNVLVEKYGASWKSKA